MSPPSLPRHERAAAALLALICLTLCAGAQGGSSTFGGPGPLLRQADGNADGRVDADEWKALLAALPAERDGKLDAIALKARLLPLDVDGDGQRTAADVQALFAKLDRDGNGVLSAEERQPPARASAAEEMLAVLAIPAADSDKDGTLSAAERERFLSSLQASDGGQLGAQIAAWVRAVVSSSGRERALFSPAVLIAQLDAELDADGDGRLTKEDLQALFTQVDGDGDGALSGAELAPRRAARAGGEEPQWFVSPEQRARPPLMPWQRTLDDALALSKASGKPLLICVNMDNEPASEFAAYARYNDPGFAALAAGFIPVVASPDTHSPLPRDDRGRRLPDVRLGRVLCKEHIAIEPLLFARYFGGERFAPRHVGVAPDGTLLFDIKLVQSFEGLERALRTHGRPDPAPAPDASTLDDETLLASPDARLRDELESRFPVLDLVRRLRIAESALSAERPVQHPDIVALALRDDDSSVRMQGVRVMIRHPQHMDLELVPEAMAFAAVDPDLERELLAALEAAAQAEDATRRARAGKLHASYAGLAQASRLIDAKLWIPLFAVGQPPAGGANVEALSEALTALLAQSNEKPKDRDLRVHLALGWLRLAEAQLASGGNPSFTLQDADAAAATALELDPAEPRALGVSARAKYLLGDTDTAAELAEKALPGLLREAGSPLSRSVLETFVQARTRQLYAAMGGGAFPPEWAADLLAGHEVLLADPLALEARWVAFLQLLEALEARRPLARAVGQALHKYPYSNDLHAWLRFQVLRDQGSAALEAAYEGEALAELRAADPPACDWFHGLALLFVAEHGVRTRSDQVARAYERCGELFQRSAAAAPQYAASAAHYRALALAGLARLELAAGRRAEALAHVLEALAAGPAVARAADGLGATPLQLARDLRRRLIREGDAAGAERLQAALDGLGVEEAPAGQR